MHNTSSSFQTLLLRLESPWKTHISSSSFYSYCHGSSNINNVTTIIPWFCWKEKMGGAFLSLYSLNFFFLLLSLFLFSSSILLSKVLQSPSSHGSAPSSIRTATDGDENVGAVTGDEWTEKEDLVAEVVGGEDLLFLCGKSGEEGNPLVEQGRDTNVQDSFELDGAEMGESTTYVSPVDDLAFGLEYIDIPIGGDVSSLVGFPSLAGKDLGSDHIKENSIEIPKICSHEEGNFVDDDSSFILDHSQLRNKILLESKQAYRGEEENFADSSTCGSTSKSSHEWRNSTNFRDSETECLFSSSSRRSSSKWESYTVYRKYDDEMMFFDRISAQKLTETESLRSMEVHPRSISQRIVYKLKTKEKPIWKKGVHPYQELEAAYVAQICLAWEALNWNYMSFQQVNAKKTEADAGCPAHIAQQFQQFQVLLQRFIENEPYEHGRRPEIYARTRISTPKLLQVPEFRGSEETDENKPEDMNWKISTAIFFVIMEDAIRTFLKFLNADKESHWQVLRALVKKKPNSVDPTLLHFIKKANEKKKSRIKDLRRSQKCLRKRKLKEEEEMEILMALIDMKVVGRVLRMPEISEQQLHWCEEKMRKVRVWQGKIQRDSSPLFFPTH